jgi:effector-binding domain-containing protein
VLAYVDFRKTLLHKELPELSCSGGGRNRSPGALHSAALSPLRILKGEVMNLTQNPELVNAPEMHYVFVERIGPFMENAGAAWQQAHSMVPALLENNEITGYMALYRVGPKIYRAGFSISSAPVKLPEGFKYEKFHGGKYVRFVLTGPYDNLPQASGRAWAVVGEKKIDIRDDFAIEQYVNDPRMTPTEQLITHIMIPTV